MRTALLALLLSASTAAFAGQSTKPADIDSESLSRLPVVKRDSLDDNGKRIYDYIAGQNKTAPKTGPGGVTLHSPVPAEPIQMLNQALRKTVLGQAHFEICALLAAWEFDQQYEWSGHEPGAVRAGVSQNVIDAIKYNRGLEGLPEKEATLIQMGRQLFRGNHQLSSEVWAKAVRLFGVQGALEATMIMGDYAMAAIFLNAVNQQLPPERPALLPVRK